MSDRPDVLPRSMSCLLLMVLSDSSPNFSNRLLPSDSIWYPVTLGLWRALTVSVILVIPSHISQPSHALLPMPLPRIISPMTSATRVRRQLFPRSSVGKRTASAPCMSSCRYAPSFCDCSSAVLSTSTPGAGENAGCGISV